MPKVIQDLPYIIFPLTITKLLDFEAFTDIFFPLTITKLLDFEAFTEIFAQDNAREAQWRVLLSDGDITKRSSMMAFTTGEENWLNKLQNSKYKLTDTVNPVKIPPKCLCQPDVALNKKDLLQRPL